MLLADSYSECFSKFKLSAMPSKYNDRPFVGANNVLVYRTEASIHDLPSKEFNFVAVSCWRIGPASSTLTFGAETEMYRVLQVKGRTGGLSSEKLGGRNVHIWLGPVDLPHKLRSSAGIVDDFRFKVPGSSASVAELDLAHSLFPVERHGHIRRIEESATSRLWMPKKR